MTFIQAMQAVMSGSYVSRSSWLSIDNMHLYTNGVGFQAIVQVYKSGESVTANLLSGDLLGTDYFIVTNPIVSVNNVDLPAGANSYGGTPV